MKSTTTTLRALFLVAFFSVLTTYSFGKNFSCYIDSDVTNTNQTYDFSIVVKASSGTINFNGFQFGLYVNPSFLSSGTISATGNYYGQGSSGTIGWDNTNQMIRISVDTGTACGSPTAINSVIGRSVYHIQLSTTGTWGCFAPDLKFNFGNVVDNSSTGTVDASSPWPTKIDYWESCSPDNIVDITANGTYNGTAYAITYFNSDQYTNAYWGRSVVSPAALNPVGVTYYADFDGDLYRDQNNKATSCFTAPSGYYPIYTLPVDSTIGAEHTQRHAGDHLWDCQDAGSVGFGALYTHPGAVEICSDGIDDNCNGFLDDDINDGLPLTTYYNDADFDYWGNPAGPTIQHCVDSVHIPSLAIGATRWSLDNTDCNDNSQEIHESPTVAFSSTNGLALCNGASTDLHPYVRHTVPYLLYGVDDSLTYNRYSADSSVAHFNPPYEFVTYVWSTAETT